MSMTLLLGGARSGKSAMAVRLGEASSAPVTFIATALAGDDEMALRIARHQESRPVEWTTVEAPVDLLGAVRSAAGGDFLVVDCLTVWVSNLLGQGALTADIDAAAAAVLQSLRGRDCVVVTNEVGLGIVPVNELARGFRDTLGSVNALFAASADQAVLMVAGRALDLSNVDHVIRSR
ncbi:MAG TPA: bifunctional adenosylcobinamide kinase/adenosylcobinamide-phosphate guanylyltransferase [Candidatus Dormibacteraeota bacterium]|jgi:adenosyl cobinamide kinase/adenosyl cobinamide phosphate guanylyltransferase|nr:bifunctional adenosylcobinamide kinase/adenosylcobinamide-phosphate guanylyltransferase [Candidatus Dormibacteraeota bacterium]